MGKRTWGAISFCALGRPACWAGRRAGARSHLLQGQCRTFAFPPPRLRPRCPPASACPWPCQPPIDPAKGKRKLAWRTVEPATTTPPDPSRPSRRMRSRCANSISAAHAAPARLLGRSWHARVIAAGLCSPVWPPVFDGETPGATHHHHAYIASTPASPR